MGINPLACLPPEIVLRILRHASLVTIVRLTACSKAWHTFIDDVHFDEVYSEKAERPSGYRDLSFLDKQESYTQYMKDVKTWKGLCINQTLLRSNFDQDAPRLQQSFIRIGRSPVWRFRPDFKNRFFLSTSQSGGLAVTDMDTGSLLWWLPRDRVHLCAHLEYSEGWAAWDCGTNAIEIWRTSPDLPRGEFAQVAIIPHDVETRGFHLIYPTLCVVSTQGRAFTYDLSSGSPRKVVDFRIDEDAIGHLTQSEAVVAITMGRSGFHFFDKNTGLPLGGLSQRNTTPENIHHIPPPDLKVDGGTSVTDTTSTPIPMPAPTSTLMTRLHLQPGHRSLDRYGSLTPHLSFDNDQWGAGLISGKAFVGISRGGRCLICTDYEAALQSRTRAQELTTIIEYQTDPAFFDAGGWLAFKHNRVLFEVGDSIYVLVLSGDENMSKPCVKSISAFPMSSSPRLKIPVSWMGAFDDCFMSTYGLVTAFEQEQGHDGFGGWNRVGNNSFVTKVIRIVSWAPDVHRLGEWGL